MKFDTDYKKFLQKALDSRRGIFFKGVDFEDSKTDGEFDPDKLKMIQFSFEAPGNKTFIYTVNSTIDGFGNEIIEITTKDLHGSILGYDTTAPYGWWIGIADAIQRIKDDGTFATVVDTRKCSLWFSTEPYNAANDRKYEPAWTFSIDQSHAIRCSAYGGSVYEVTGV
jgi:hypothetical protein